MAAKFANQTSDAENAKVNTKSTDRTNDLKTVEVVALQKKAAQDPRDTTDGKRPKVDPVTAKGP